jgi:hypothetical protein
MVGSPLWSPTYHNNLVSYFQSAVSTCYTIGMDSTNHSGSVWSLVQTETQPTIPTPVQLDDHDLLKAHQKNGN